MSAAPNITEQLTLLAEQLAAEPFCRKYSLQQQTLAKVSHFIEQRDSSQESLALESKELRESFRQFKAIYCLFLMQLEQLVPPGDSHLNERTLANYIRSEARNALGIASETDSPPEPSPVDENEEGAGEKTVMGNIYNFVTGADPAPAPRGPVVTPVKEPEQKPTDAEETEQTDSIVVDLLAPTPAPPPEAQSVGDNTVAGVVEWEPDPVDASPQDWASDAHQDAAVTPEPEPIVPQFIDLEEEPDAMPALAPTAQPSAELSAPPAGPAEPSLTQSREYFALHLYLEALDKQGAGIPKEPLRRLQAMMLCFSVETELRGKFGAGWEVALNTHSGLGAMPAWPSEFVEELRSLLTSLHALMEAAAKPSIPFSEQQMADCERQAARFFEQTHFWKQTTHE